MDPQAEALIHRLRTQPDDVESYESLKAHYHTAGDFASLANLVEGWAGRHTEAAAANAFHEAARTVSYYLEDQLRAVELLETALDNAPDHSEANDDLARLLEAIGDPEAYVASLARRARRYANADADPASIAAIHFQIGELWERTLERPDQAVVHYRSAFELDPEHLPAMYATREIYRQSGDLRSAAHVYDLEIAAEVDTARKVMLLRELAHLEHEGLSDPDASISALDRALGHTPHDREVTYELAGALLARAAVRGDSPDGLLDRAKAADMLLRLAHGAEGETQVAFLESALDASPDHDAALTFLESVAAVARAEARLPLRWIRYVGLAPNGPNSAARRIRLADAYESAGQLADTIMCLEPLLASGDVEIARRLVGLYTREGRVEDARKAQGIVGASLSPDERRVALEDELAHAAVGSDDAARLIADLDAIDPSNAKVGAVRLDHLRARGEHAALRDLLLARAEDSTQSVAVRSSAYREVALLADGPLADADLAVRVRGSLVKLSPGDRDERAKLKQAMRLGQRWDELANILVWEAANEDEADARRNAALSVDELTERAALDAGRAIDALEGIYKASPTDVAVRDRLLTRLVAAGRNREALPLIESKAESAPTTRDKAGLLDQAATIRLEFGDIVGAIAALERWIAADPDATEPARRALELAERSGDAAQIARAVSREADRSQGDERARWLMRLADLEANSLGSDDRAIDALIRATEAAPNDERIRIELENAFRRSERFVELRDSIRVRVPKQATVEDRVALLREIAHLSEHELTDRRATAIALRELRTVAEDATALDWLIDDARSRGDTEELTALLSVRLELKSAPEEKNTTGLELAELLDREGGDRARARTILESLRGVAPNPVAALGHLARICEADGDQVALASAWSDLLDHIEEPKRAIELAKALHALAVGPLSSESHAAKGLAHWSKHAPSELAPLEALVALHLNAGRERDAADALLELGKRLDSPSDAESKLLEASDRYETAGDLAAAMEAARLARSLGFGSSAARQRLGIVAERASRFDVVLEVAEARAADAAKKGESGRGDLITELLACASIAREKLNDGQRASTYLLRASELAEGNAEAVARVEAAATEIDRSASDASAVLERALVTRLLERAKSEEGEVRVARLVRASTILANAIGDFGGAFQLLADVTEEDANPTLLDALVSVATSGAKTSELEQLLKKRFDESVDSDTARAILEAQVNMYTRVNRASDAADVLQRILSMRTTVENRDRLLDALARAGRHKDRVNVLEQAIRRAGANEDERNALGRQVAVIWETELANKFEALDAWKRLLRWCPTDVDATHALDRLGVKRNSLPPPPAKPAEAAANPSTPPRPSAPPPPAKPAEAAAKPSTPPRPSAPPPPPARVLAAPPPPARVPAVPSLATPRRPPEVNVVTAVYSVVTDADASALGAISPDAMATHGTASASDEPITAPPPAPVVTPLVPSMPVSIPRMPPPALPREAAAMLAESQAIESVEEVESLDDVEALDDFEDVDDVEEVDSGTPQKDHVRPHVSLPPPPPKRGQ